MRAFELHRDVDVTGISGTGVVAKGVEFASEGPVVIRWLGETPSTVIWGSIEDVYKINGHGGATRVVWVSDWDAVWASEVPVTGQEGVTQLYHNDWVSLRVIRKPEDGIDGYVYSHETRCAGRIVAILPFRDTANGHEFLIKSEVTPCWSLDPVLSAITGKYEGGDIEDDAVREMSEETGYTVARSDLIPLGRTYASKSADTLYSLFAVNLTGLEAGEAGGDGSRLEAESTAVWISESGLYAVRDPQVAAMYLRLHSFIYGWSEGPAVKLT